jgi:hypothetical protein
MRTIMSEDQGQEHRSEIPDHESPVRRLYSDAHGLPYRALHSLDQAKACPDGVVVLEGDWGGQIYVVCPAKIVACDEATLKLLLQDLDALAWSCNDGEGARVYFERAAPGTGVAGGMGGGIVTDEIWIHRKLQEKNLAAKIRSVILGERSRLEKE